MWPFTKRTKPTTRTAAATPPKPSRPVPTWNLSDVVLRFSDQDVWTLGDAFQGVQIWGLNGIGEVDGEPRVDRAVVSGDGVWWVVLDGEAGGPGGV